MTNTPSTSTYFCDFSDLTSSRFATATFRFAFNRTSNRQLGRVLEQGNSFSLPFTASPRFSSALLASALSSVKTKMELDPKKVVEVYERYEAVGDQFLLTRNQMVENDRERNANREALTALRKKARTTKTSVPSPFDSMMKDTHGSSTNPLVQEVCSTCGSHDSSEPTWMMLPGTDLFAAVPFHAVHTMLEKDEKRMEFESKKLQSLLKEKTLLLSELGALADSVPPSVIRSLITLKDKPSAQ